MYHNNRQTKLDTIRLTTLIVLISLFFYWGKNNVKEGVVTVYAKSIEAPVSSPTPPQPTETPEPTVRPTIKPKKVTTAPNTVKDKIRQTFGEEGAIMEEVAFCESSFNPEAKSKSSTAKGVYQIINGTWKHYGCTGDPLNEDDNIRCAKKIWDRRGTVDWDASKHCWGN